MAKRNLRLLALLLLGLLSSWASGETYRAQILPNISFGKRSVALAFGISESNKVGVVGEENLRIEHAALWTEDELIDLHPAGFIESIALRASGQFQVGQGKKQVGSSDFNHALLWNGTTESAVDLNPMGFDASTAHAVFGDVQVGYGVPDMGLDRALMWKGTPDNYVDLHPQGYISSRAFGISGDYQCGIGQIQTTAGMRDHALLWQGSADSVVDLHPPGMYTSIAYDVSGNVQVGDGYPVFFTSHAMLWKGTAESVVDLHPTGYYRSSALAVEGDRQVGSAFVNNGPNHAMLWRGSAATALDLHQFLTSLSVSITDSVAMDVDSNGVIAGYGIDRNELEYAIIWMPIPEPASIGLVCSTAIALIAFQRRLFGRIA